MLARFFGLIIFLAILLALPATKAQDAKSKTADPAASTIDADTLKAGEYVGKLLASPGTDGLFTLRIDLSHYEAKDATAATQVTNQLNADLQRARQLEQQVALNPSQRQLNALQQVYNDIRRKQARQRDLYNVVPDSKDVEFHAASDMTVRFLLPPVHYDDKGERKTLSLLDLQEMRGTDPNVPGFEAKLTDLQTNQIVRVSLRPAKPGAAKPKTSSSADSDKAKAKSAPKMEAAMALIVVAEDLTPVKQDGDTGKKKKKPK